MSNIKVTLENTGIDKKELTKFGKFINALKLKQYIKSYTPFQIMKKNL